MMNYSKNDRVWYAMKTTFKRELKAKAYLDSCNIECFVPMQQIHSTKAGKKNIILRPALSNLLFIKATAAQLSEIKLNLTYIHNRLFKSEGRLLPMVVPTVQMEQFIRANTYLLDQITYVDSTSTLLDKGTRVRIIDGDFKGYVGVLKKIKGKRDRRVTINIEGLVAYTVDVNASFVEEIK